MMAGKARADAAAGEVEAAAHAFEAGDLHEALTRAHAACAADPRSVEAHHWRAASLAELGRLEEARRAYERALELDADDLDVLLGASELYLNRMQSADADRATLTRGLELAQHGAKRARKAKDDAAAGEFALLEGIALNQLGHCRDALARLELALRHLPADLDALLERGIAMYELCRFAEARAQLDDVVRRAPDEAWAHHYLGLLAERRGEPREAERRFLRARKLAPGDFPRPIGLSAAAFDRAVEDALLKLPPQVRDYLENVAVAVEDLPAEDDLLASDPPLSPSILGVFRGAPWGEKGSDPWSHFPSSIVLYQRNLERFARDKSDLIEQIGITLIHEVGHFLGFDEEDLWERGLE